jgi:hypothetical protein
VPGHASRVGDLETACLMPPTRGELLRVKP